MPSLLSHANSHLNLDLMESVASESIDFIDNVKEMSPEERILALKKIGTLLSDSLKRGEEKVSLAKTTFDTVFFLPYPLFSPFDQCH
jgi:hypothetical protein